MPPRTVYSPSPRSVLQRYNNRGTHSEQVQLYLQAIVLMSYLANLKKKQDVCSGEKLVEIAEICVGRPQKEDDGQWTVGVGHCSFL